VSARSWCESLPCPDEDVCFPEHLSVNCHTGKRTFLVEKPEARAHRPAEAKTQKWNYATYIGVKCGRRSKFLLISTLSAPCSKRCTQPETKLCPPRLSYCKEQKSAPLPRYPFVKVTHYLVSVFAKAGESVQHLVTADWTPSTLQVTVSIGVLHVKLAGLAQFEMSVETTPLVIVDSCSSIPLYSILQKSSMPNRSQ
jgi:hypothetical protein